MRLQTKIKGDKELTRVLQALPNRVQKNVLQGATIETLREIPLKPIKEAAPRHERGKRSQASKKYGTLKSNIRVSKLKRVRKGSKGARISTGNAFWGALIERGTRYISAKPWFRPTFSRLQNSIFKTLGLKIGIGIEREARKISKIR